MHHQSGISKGPATYGSMCSNKDRSYSSNILKNFHKNSIRQKNTTKYVICALFQIFSFISPHKTSIILQLMNHKQHIIKSISFILEKKSYTTHYIY